jgi:hypothetical protein
MHVNADTLSVLLLSDLYTAGWEDSGFYPGISQRQVAMSSLALSLLKKFHNDEHNEERDNKALALFLECNERCRIQTQLVPRRLDEEYVIGELKSILWDFFNPPISSSSKRSEPLLLNLSDIASHFSLGSGSNIGASSTDFYTKYVTSTMSYTDPALPILFRHAISGDNLWTGIENFRSNKYGTEMVRGNRLSFVPKSRVISRTICTEPLLNMFFQKGIGGVLEGRLKEVSGINLSKQPDKNATLARIGSESGKFGTIDLSSASDSISISLLREILPSEAVSWLLRCRSPLTILPDGQEIELHMISSMGNGFTFPLQTMIFSCLVRAVYRICGINITHPRGQSLGNYGVFGDDIIVDSRAYDLTCRCLSVLGFTVNSDKSFNEGLFRESCGHDFYCGYNVRGVYLKTLLDANDVYSAINRLNRWSATHGIFLHRTVSYLRRGCRFLGVPYDESDDSGIKVPESLLRTLRRDRNGAIYYLASVTALRRVRIPSVEADGTISQKDLIRIRCILPDFEYLPDGLLFCFLAGWLRDSSLGLRVIRPKAVLRRRRTPCWERGSFGQGVNPGYHEHWKMFVEANLVS